MSPLTQKKTSTKEQLFTCAHVVSQADVAGRINQTCRQRGRAPRQR